MYGSSALYMPDNARRMYPARCAVAPISCQSCLPLRLSNDILSQEGCTEPHMGIIVKLFCCHNFLIYYMHNGAWIYLTYICLYLCILFIVVNAKYLVIGRIKFCKRN